jgi:uncharacterized protein
MRSLRGIISAGLLVAALTAHAELPRISIVIDDLGFQPGLDQAIMAMDERLTVAIIPEAPAARKLARQAGRQRRDVLIHLPLAGFYHDDCQPVLTCIGMDWSVEQMQELLLAALGEVEGAIGLNNHQGSRFTSDSVAVGRLVTGISQISEQRRQPLLVLDSRTAPGSLLEQKARKAGLPAGRRHVFLDHSNEPEDIERAWQHLLDLAREHGSAIAIGHPRSNTIRFLEEMLPALVGEGVELVPVSDLAERPQRTWRAVLDAGLTSAP